ncbi:MAG: hypothetical protein WCK35_24500 [Chloroflexota bacterium]
MPSILFVCRANQFRSPIAASIFQQELKLHGIRSGWRVESAGTWAKTGSIVPYDVLVWANQLGVSGISRHVCRQVTSEILDPFDLIIVMENSQKEAIQSEFISKKEFIYLLSEMVDGQIYDIPDPARPGVDPELIISDIRSHIQNNFHLIIELAEKLHLQRVSSD